jgi:hypothetical protein
MVHSKTTMDILRHIRKKDVTTKRDLNRFHVTGSIIPPKISTYIIITGVSWENQKERDHSEDRGVDGWMVSEWIL